MSYEPQAAQRYRQYAEELRVIAEDKAHSKSRETLLALAAECLQMADNFDAIERTNRAGEKGAHATE
jgi:hypothetical protein